jgi:hypothetical protein
MCGGGKRRVSADTLEDTLMSSERPFARSSKGRAYVASLLLWRQDHPRIESA